MSCRVVPLKYVGVTGQELACVLSCCPTEICSVTGPEPASVMSCCVTEICTCYRIRTRQCTVVLSMLMLEAQSLPVYCRVVPLKYVDVTGPEKINVA